MPPRRGRGAQSRTMGLRNLSAEQLARWDKLLGRKLLVTKFADIPTLQTLGLETSVVNLLTKVGLEGFLMRNAETYHRMTLEFLATVTKQEGDDPDDPVISFHLNDAEYNVRYSHIREILGVRALLIGDYHGQGFYDASAFWYALTRLPKTADDKSTRIRHPALRYVHRLLVMTFFGRGEVTKINSDDLKCLWSMTASGRGVPDWVDYWVDRCIEISESEKGKISLGGMVTLLARGVNAAPQADDFVVGDDVHVLDMKKLIESSFITRARGPNECIFLYGKSNNFMPLPQPNPQRIYIPPESLFPEDFFLAPDHNFEGGVYIEWIRLGGVEDVPDDPDYEYDEGDGDEDEPDEMMEEAEEEDEEEAEEDAEESPDEDYTPPTRRTRRQRLDFLEDRVDEMYYMVQAMHNFHMEHRQGYVDPTPQIRASRQRRRGLAPEDQPGPSRGPHS